MKRDVRTRVIAALLLMLTFSSGAYVSATVLELRAPSGIASIRVNAGSSLDALELTANQQAAIDQIFASRQSQIDSIIGSALERLRPVLDGVDGEVRSVLTAEQIEAYERLREGGSDVRAVRRTMTPDGDLISVDTLR